jgi:hypothetical protein
MWRTLVVSDMQEGLKVGRLWFKAGLGQKCETPSKSQLKEKNKKELAVCGSSSRVAA